MRSAHPPPPSRDILGPWDTKTVFHEPQIRIHTQITPSGPCDSQLASSVGQVGGHPVVVQSEHPEVPELGLGPATPPHSGSLPETMVMGTQAAPPTLPGGPGSPSTVLWQDGFNYGI